MRNSATLEAENAQLRNALEKAALRQESGADILAGLHAAAEADHLVIKTLRAALASAHVEAKAALDALVASANDLTLSRAEAGVALADLAAREKRARPCARTGHSRLSKAGDGRSGTGRITT